MIPRVTLALFTALFVIGTYFFASGFLLTRVELDTVSDAKRNPSPDGPPQWPDAAYTRLVLVVVDALRWDFVAPIHVGSQVLHWHNRLARVQSLLRSNSSQILAFPFVSDAPTTTAQRLKALATGGLPTFIDVSKNFASANVSEDNWIDQAAKAGKRITFLGDDTWLSLFGGSGRFHRWYPYPSFNVRDLHTVDDGVLSHLHTELARPDWDVLIAHFLGVDHVGHTHGPNHPAMQAKLEQMDNVLADLMQYFAVHEKESLLIVIGDHGMTSDGNHGGASPLELEASLLMYAPRGLHPRHDQSGLQRVPQIDLVPTICAALGIPIPFGNLGAVIPEPFSHFQYSEALHINAWQVHRFLSEYSSVRSDFSSAALDDLRGHLVRAQQLWANGDRNAALRAFDVYLREAAAMCRSAWAAFDVSSMVLGLIVLLLVVGSSWCVFLMDHASLAQVDTVLFAALLGSVAAPLIFVMALSSFALGLGLAVPAAILYTYGPAVISSVLRGPVRIPVAAAVCVVLHGAGLFSNSFIEAEFGVTRFLLVSLLLWIALQGNVHALAAALLCTVIPGRVESPLMIAILAFASVWWTLRHHLNSLLMLMTSAVLSVHFFIRVAHAEVFASSAAIRLVIPWFVFVICVYLVVAVRPHPRPAASLLLLLLWGPGWISVGMWAVVIWHLESKITAALPDAFTGATLRVLIARVLFYASGHACDFSTLHFDAGFVGLDHAMPLASGFLIAVNALGPFAMGALSRERKWFVWVLGVDVMLTSAFVFGARRHLMVWRVFAPKYVYDSMTLLVAATVSLL